MKLRGPIRFEEQTSGRALRWGAVFCRPLLLLLLLSPLHPARAQAPTSVTNVAADSAKNSAELLDKLNKLVDQNLQLEKQNQELMSEIHELREYLSKAAEAPAVSSSRMSPTNTGLNTETPSATTALASAHANGGGEHFSGAWHSE